MSADLSSDPNIASTYAEIRNQDSPVDWLYLGYAEGSKDRLILLDRGEGGLDPLKAALARNHPGNIYFALLRLEGRLLLITYLPEDAGGVRRARALVHSRAVGARLNHHATLTIPRIDDLTLSAARSKLRLDTGSAASSLPPSPNPQGHGSNAPSPSPLRAQFPSNAQDYNYNGSHLTSPPSHGNHQVEGRLSPTVYAEQDAPPPMLPAKDQATLGRVPTNSSVRSASLAQGSAHSPHQQQQQYQQQQQAGTQPASPSSTSSRIHTHPSLFGPQHQVHQHRRSASGTGQGLGLGLPTAAQYAQEHRAVSENPRAMSHFPCHTQYSSQLEALSPRQQHSSTPLTPRSPRSSSLNTDAPQKEAADVQNTLPTSTPYAPQFSLNSPPNDRASTTVPSPETDAEVSRNAATSQALQQTSLERQDAVRTAQSLEASTLESMLRPSDDSIEEGRNENTAFHSAATSIQPSLNAHDRASPSSGLPESTEAERQAAAEAIAKETEERWQAEQAALREKAEKERELEAKRVREEADKEEEERRAIEAHDRAEKEEAERKAAEEEERVRLAEVAKQEEEAKRKRDAEEEEQRRLAEEERQRKEEEERRERERLEEEARIEREREEAKQKSRDDLRMRLTSAPGEERRSEAALTGFLSVQGGASILWRRRYFELAPTGLRLYKSDKESDRRQPIDTIDVSGGRIKTIDLASEELMAIPHSFKVVFKDQGDEPYLFYCDEEGDRELVVLGLKAAAGIA